MQNGKGVTPSYTFAKHDATHWHRFRRVLLLRSRLLCNLNYTCIDECIVLHILSTLFPFTMFWLLDGLLSAIVDNRISSAKGTTVNAIHMFILAWRQFFCQRHTFPISTFGRRRTHFYYSLANPDVMRSHTAYPPKVAVPVSTVLFACRDPRPFTLFTSSTPPSSIAVVFHPLLEMGQRAMPRNKY